MLCEFKASTETVGLGIHPDKTKILSNQDKVKAKEITVSSIKIEVLAKGDSARYLGQKITFEEQETEAGTYLKRLSIVPQTSSVRYGHHANIDLRKWNVDTIEKTRQNDQDCTTKNVSPYRTDKKNTS